MQDLPSPLLIVQFNEAAGCVPTHLTLAGEVVVTAKSCLMPSSATTMQTFSSLLLQATVSVIRAAAWLTACPALVPTLLQHAGYQLLRLTASAALAAMQTT